MIQKEGTCHEKNVKLSFVLFLFVLKSLLNSSDALQLGLKENFVRRHSLSYPECQVTYRRSKCSLATSGKCSLPVRNAVYYSASEVSLCMSSTPTSEFENGEKDTLSGDDNLLMNWTRPTLAIAVPALIGMIADPLLSLMDTLYVARLGSVELAALGPCTSIFHLAFNAFRATTAATTSLVAGALQEGRNDTSTSEIAPNESAKEVLKTTLYFSTFSGVLVAWILISSSKFSLSCMGVPITSVLYPHAMSYLRIRSLAAPAVLFITVSEGAFRGYCDTRTPLLASLTAAVINAVFDPILMFKPFNMGVGGAAAATAGSQIAAMLVYMYMIYKRNMIGSRREVASVAVKHQKSPRQRRNIIFTILRANTSMLIKQFSLLIAWAYATARATSIGHAHVAAHQIALSLWLVFALIQDGLAVAAQILMSRTTTLRTRRSLTTYMLKASIFQSAVCSLFIYLLRGFVPTVFSKDPLVLEQLQRLMPVLAAFQPLVSVTLVLESIVVGGNCFTLLAVGTALATVVSMAILKNAKSVVSLWMYGLTGLFIGRLITAVIGVVYLNGVSRPKRNKVPAFWNRTHLKSINPVLTQDVLRTML